MKTSKFNKEIKKVNEEIGNLKIQHKSLSYKKDEKSTKIKEDIDRQMLDLNIKLSGLKNDLHEHERKMDKIKFRIGWTATGLLFVMLIVGMVLLIKYNYELGLYGLTTNHDVISILNGKDTLISVDLYNHLFLLRILGKIFISFGVLGTIISGVVTMWWGSDNNVI